MIKGITRFHRNGPYPASKPTVREMWTAWALIVLALLVIYAGLFALGTRDPALPQTSVTQQQLDEAFALGWNHGRQACGRKTS
jgi:hypothetical protein